MFDNFLPILDAGLESLPFYPLVLKLIVCVEPSMKIAVFPSSTPGRQGGLQVAPRPGPGPFRRGLASE